MPYAPIHEYGLIGDMNSCALVRRDGSIDWACFPRFDSPSAFAAILDDTKGGRFRIHAVDEHLAEQRYVTDTTVLETTFTTGTGSAIVVDFMTLAGPVEPTSPHEIVRVVRGVSGTVRLRVVFQPRMDYARGETALRLDTNGVMATNHDETVGLVSPVALTLEDAGDGGKRAVGEFEISSGESMAFVAAFGLRRLPAPGSMDAQAKLQRAVRHSQATVAKLRYDGRWRDDVVRSFLTLHLLTYAPTGAIVAAPTTSLPEAIGGARNWDYRYSWLRDGAWTAGILFRLGDPHEGTAFVEWLEKQCRHGLEDMRILYGIEPSSPMSEHELPHLEGYRGSTPVRIGNGASQQRQLDVFGEVALALSAYQKHHGELPKTGWNLLIRLATLAASNWRLPDTGIWEVRGGERHFVYSKIMCWVALDRAINLSESHGYAGPVEFWRHEAEQIRADILTNGWSEQKQSFVQAYGSDALDASALLIPFVGFLEPDDPRLRSTVRAVQRELSQGPFVKRYRIEEVDDGVGGEEGAFYILSFWLIGALLAIGETEEAVAYFDELRSTANHLGLFAEMLDPNTGEGLGNFPQAFSHIGLIHTARNLSQVLRTDTFHEEILG